MQSESNQFDDFGDPTQHKPACAGRSFSWKRVLLLLGLLVLMGLPKAWRDYCDRMDKLKQDEQRKQEKLDREINDTISKVRDGELQAGPAFKRLFGIEEPAKDARTERDVER